MANKTNKKLFVTFLSAAISRQKGKSRVNKCSYVINLDVRQPRQANDSASIV